VEIAPEAGRAYRGLRGGVALLCTGSRLEEIAPSIEIAAKAGLHVVSSCEELANAAFVDPDLADWIDRVARQSRVSVLGTGVNPGFVFDRLIATLGGVTGEIRKVEAGRVVDLLDRRVALRSKAGVGLSVAAFEEALEQGNIGHIGLSESCSLVIDGLSMDVDEIEESVDPIVADSDLDAGGVHVDKGKVIGVRQVAQAFDEGREVVRLTLELSLAPAEPRDWIRIDGDPPLEVVIPGGISGDKATAWALAHAAVRVASSEAGLLSVLDLPAGR
jgi:4-hydroxy-tetrahydrodipicolinate reductase